MNPQEILNRAAQMERDGRAFYLKAAAESSNVLAKQMFEAFAAEEARHLSLIESLAAKRGVTLVPSDFTARLKNIFTSAPESLRAGARAADGDRKAIAFALEIEEKSYNLYKEWETKASAPEVRDLCRFLAEEENRHYRLFANIGEYLDRTADWFMREEHWIFEGG